MAALFVVNEDEVIDAQSWEESDPVAKQKKAHGLMMRIWISLSRRVRRILSRGGEVARRLINKIPEPMRLTFRVAAAVFGFVVGYILAYLIILIAFSYGLVPGFITTFIVLWMGCTVLAMSY